MPPVPTEEGAVILKINPKDRKPINSLHFMSPSFNFIPQVLKFTVLAKHKLQKSKFKHKTASVESSPPIRFPTNQIEQHMKQTYSTVRQTYDNMKNTYKNVVDRLLVNNTIVKNLASVIPKNTMKNTMKNTYKNVVNQLLVNNTIMKNLASVIPKNIINPYTKPVSRPGK